MNKQILDVVASVSMEKGVDKTIIFQALEEAIASATKKLVDDEANIDVVIDTTTGEYKTYRKWDIVKEIDESEVFQVLESDLDRYEVDEATASKEIENKKQLLVEEQELHAIDLKELKKILKENIPQVEQVEFSKIEDKYLFIMLINRTIWFIISFIGCVIMSNIEILDNYSIAIYISFIVLFIFIFSFTGISFKKKKYK